MDQSLHMMTGAVSTGASGVITIYYEDKIVGNHYFFKIGLIKVTMNSEHLQWRVLNTRQDDGDEFQENE